jgi:hypothetical protein
LGFLVSVALLMIAKPSQSATVANGDKTDALLESAKDTHEG